MSFFKIISKFLLLFSVVLFLTACQDKEKEKKVGYGGVYKSNDGGEIFLPINYISEDKDLSHESITDIALDPQHPDVVYVGTKQHGIFRSKDGGQTWAESQSDFSYIGRIRLDPFDENVIYLIAESQGEMALFKTIDQGVNWERLLLQRDEYQPIVLDVLVNPKNSNIIYATDSTGGIYKSTDAGETWKAVYWAEYPATAIVSDWQNPDIVYFATGEGDVYYTRDGGETFSTINGGGRLYSLAVSRSEEGVLYLLYESGLYVAREAGEKIDEVPTLLKPKATVANIVAVDPVNKDTIYIVAGKVLYKTRNGGETWRAVPLDIRWRANVFRINPFNTQQLYLGLIKPASNNQGLLNFGL